MRQLWSRCVGVGHGRLQRPPAAPPYAAEALESRVLLAVDLSGTSFDAAPEAPVPGGGQLTISYAVRNSGTTNAPSFIAAFYLSADATIGTGDMLLAEVNVVGLGAGLSRTGSIVPALPATDPFRNDNQYYLGMILDRANLVAESDETNNSNRGDGLDRDAVSSEDHLGSPASGTTVSALLAPFGFAFDVEIGTDEWIGAYDLDTYRVNLDSPTTVQFDVDLPAGSGLDSYMRLYDTSWTLLASNNNALAPGEPAVTGNLASYLGYTFATAGSYFLVVGGNGNHTSDPRLLTGRSAASTGPYSLTLTRSTDLVAQSVTVTPNGPVPAGGAVTAAYELVNSGDVPAGPFTIRFHLTDDPAVDAADTLVGSVEVAGLARGATLRGTEPLALGAYDPFRTDNLYYVVMSVDRDNRVPESSNANNEVRDEISSEADLPSPATGTTTAATPVVVSSVIEGGIGNEWIGPFDRDTYAFTAQAGQQLVIDYGGPLSSGLTLFDSSFAWLQWQGGQFLRINFTAPATGTYYVGVTGASSVTTDPRLFARGRAVYEGDYTLTVALQRPDLRPSLLLGGEEALSIAADGRLLLDKIEVLNAGYAASAATTVAYYLSDDATVTTSDVLVATEAVPGLNVGGVHRITPYTLNLPAPDPFRIDNQYYVGMIVDPGNQVAEIFDDDNTYVSRSITSERHASSPAGIAVDRDVLTLPNNVMIDAAIGDEWIGARDVDVFRVAIAFAGLTVGFDLDRPAGSGLDTHLRLYDTAGSLLAENDNGAAPGEPAGGTDSYIQRTFEAAGFYRLVVSAIGNHSAVAGVLTGRVAASTGAYSISMLTADLAGAARSSPTTLPVPLNGRLTVDYTIQNLGLSAAPSTVGFYLSSNEFVDTSDPLLGTVPVSLIATLGTYTASILFDLTPYPVPRTTNHYWILMRVDTDQVLRESNELNNFHRGPGLDMLAVSAEAHLPSPSNGTAAAPTPVAIGATVAADVGGDEWIGPYDLDIYSVVVAAGQRLQLDLDRTGGTLNSFLRLYDAGWALLNASDEGAAPGEAPSVDSYLSHKFGPAGTYYVVVGALGNTSGDPRVLAARTAGPTTGAYTLTVTDVPGRVVGRHVFYNNSAFDGHDPAANAADDAAIVPDKVAHLAGGTPATHASVTSYSRGLNGVMVDVADARLALGRADFLLKVPSNRAGTVWANAPDPAVSVRQLADPAITRVTLTWPDGAMTNRWLWVTVLGTGNTGLPSADHFYFGNLVGDTPGAGALGVGAADVIRTRSATTRGPVERDNPFDHNRDGRVNGIDVITARGNVARTIPAIRPTAPAAPAGGSASDVVDPDRSGRTAPPRRHGVWSELAAAEVKW